MAKVRVYELAKEFGVESKAVMAKLQEEGVFVRSASSTIEAPVVRMLKEAFSTEAPKHASAKQAADHPQAATPRINEHIRAGEVRLVGPNDEQVGIVTLRDALRLAEETKLDLIEVAPTARPPVCKLMDYDKFKYESASLGAPRSVGQAPHVDGAPPNDGKKRWSVNIGVISFGENGGEPDLDYLQPLPFADERAHVLRNILTTLGYSSSQTTIANPSSEDLGRLVDNAIDAASADDVLVVHVLSHGHTAETGALYAIGSDGLPHSLTDIEQWLKKIENLQDQPLTLFLLDLCHSGTAARLPWQAGLADGSSRAWVIAACEADRRAFGGRFTQAIINVLKALSNGEIDINSSVRYVPVGTIAREIRREVNQLAQEAGSLPQQVTCSVIDISADLDLPFFPNPNYRHEERRQVRGSIDAALAPFLDDLDDTFDPRHFVNRAAGHGPMAEHIGSGCFSGRTDELINLTAWMNQDEDGSIRLVTGSAGVGKSALIGVVVCAAHPALRAPTRALWSRVFQVPARTPHMAAAHARQRSLLEVVQSLAKQLGLPVPTSPQALIETLTQWPTTPMLVVDALDEALEPLALMEQLLLPLAAACDSTGTPICRLLVGVRSEREFMALRDVAEASAGLIDLDAVPDDRLRRDLEEYVDKLLKSQSPYDQRAYAAARATFAGAVADSLVSHRLGRRWGEFLVAALYTHHLLTAHPPVADVSRAESLGTGVPHELHDVLELDLHQRARNSWLRPVLAALAYARGEGMPASLVRAVAPAFATNGSPSAGEVTEALDIVRFYLRLSTDSDGTTLYRLFHQGLTDYLRAHPVDRVQTAHPEESAELVLTHLLQSLTASQEFDEHEFRRWDLAEPYLLRHALQHAIDAQLPGLVLGDPEFLIHADPFVFDSFLESTSLPTLQLIQAAYRSAVEQGWTTDLRERRQILAFAAVAHGLTDLARRLAQPPGQAPLDWQPLWALVEPEAAPLVEQSLVEQSLSSHKGGVTCLAVMDLDYKKTVIVGTGSGEVVSWDLHETSRMPRLLAAHARSITSLSCHTIANEPYVVTASVGDVRMINLRSGEGVPRSLCAAGELVICVHCTELDGRPVVITGDLDGTIRFWAMDADLEIRHKLPLLPTAVTAISTAENGRFLLAADRNNAIRVWNTETCAEVELLPDTKSGSMIVVEIDGEAALWVGGNKGQARTWRLTDGKLISTSRLSGIGPIAAAAPAFMGDAAVVLVSGCDVVVDESGIAVHIVNPITGRTVGSLDGHHVGSVTALTSFRINGRSFMVSGGPNGDIHVREVRPSRIEDRIWPISTVAALTFPAGSAVIAAGTNGGIVSWDLETGECLWRRLDTPSITQFKELRIGDQDFIVAVSKEQQVFCWNPNTNTTIIMKGDATPFRELMRSFGRSLSQPSDVWDGWGPTLEEDTRPSMPQAFSAYSDRIFAVSPDEHGILTVTEFITGEILGNMPGPHANSVTALASCIFEGQPVIVSGTRDGFLCLWDLGSRELLDLQRLPAVPQMIVPAEGNRLVILMEGQLLILRRAAEARGSVS